MSARPAVVGSLPTLVTYLEMTAPPATAPLPPPRAAIEVRIARRPTLSFYRYLYETIGRDWTWVTRRLLSDRELDRILADPAVEVNVLWLAGVPAGYAELDRRQPPEIELAYFGLLARVHRRRARPLAARLDDPSRLARAAAPPLGPYLRPRSPAGARRLPKRRLSGV